MTDGTPFAFGTDQIKALEALRDLATAHPVNMAAQVGPDGKVLASRRAPLAAQMNRQTITIPFGYLVTFSIETHHPAGTCRHMSMSSPAKGRMPGVEAVDMVAEVLGFIGGYKACHCWIEDLTRGDGREKAINLVQSIDTTMKEGQA
jgi:hypothetical protein